MYVYHLSLFALDFLNQFCKNASGHCTFISCTIFIVVIFCLCIAIIICTAYMHNAHHIAFCCTLAEWIWAPEEIMRRAKFGLYNVVQSMLTMMYIKLELNKMNRVFGLNALSTFIKKRRNRAAIFASWNCMYISILIQLIYRNYAFF